MTRRPAQIHILISGLGENHVIFIGVLNLSAGITLFRSQVMHYAAFWVKCLSWPAVQPDVSPKHDSLQLNVASVDGCS